MVNMNSENKFVSI